jgi:hypothetical protein
VKRIALPVLLVLAALLALAGCGSTQTQTRTVYRALSIHASGPSAEQADAALPCDPTLGRGTMGVCTPPGPAPKFSPTAAHARLIPDVSEFQSCAIHSEVIFRVYEGGTEREDANARCHAREAKRLHVWYAVYSFLRPAHGGCAFQAERTIAIVRSLGGVIGPIIADAEVPLPGGFVTCFVRTAQRLGYVVVTYTAPGTKLWSDPFATEVWVAAYPNRPGCFSNACPHGNLASHFFIAHQFSDNFLCRGIRGDCSIDEGILSVRQTPACNSACRSHKRSDLEARIRTLRRYQKRYGCSRRRHAHQRLGPKCRRWFREGDERHRDLKKLLS